VEREGNTWGKVRNRQRSDLVGKLGDYYQDPFGFMDNLNLTIKGNNLNIFQKYQRVRITAFGLAISCLVAWIVFGFDSTPLQFFHVLFEGLPAYVMGKANWNDLTNIYNLYYGKEMHYSAFVIYGLMYWFLSRHFDKNLDIKGSKNVAYACSLTFLSVAIFEFYWMGSFAYFQHQPWVMTPKMPQLRIHMQNIAFLSVGILGVLHMYVNGFVMKGKEIIGRNYSFNWNWKAWLLIGLSVGSALLWWFYPWHVQRFSVKLETGEVWTNSQQFPQTLYTIDLDPTDHVNAGVWYWKENNLIHGWNTLVKIFWTLTVLYIGMVKRVETQK